MDENNKIVNIKSASIDIVTSTLLKNTRMPQQVIQQQTPNGNYLFNTNPGETKMNGLQRYLELSNCLAWSSPDGRLIIGKPNFSQQAMGALVCNKTDTSRNNILEFRSRRNVNTAIRKIVTQMSNMGQVDAGISTKTNHDPDMQKVAGSLVGRSLYRHFTYGDGQEAYNQIVGVGNQSGNPKTIGDVYSLREIALENMKILTVECVVKGHLNERNMPYNVDQVYNVKIEKDAVDEDMLVYQIEYDLTIDHGMLTRLHLCRLGTICTGTSIY